MIITIVDYNNTSGNKLSVINGYNNHQWYYHINNGDYDDYITINWSMDDEWLWMITMIMDYRRWSMDNGL